MMNLGHKLQVKKKKFFLNKIFKKSTKFFSSAPCQIYADLTSILPSSQVLIHSQSNPQEKYTVDWQGQSKPPAGWETPYIVLLKYCSSNDLGVTPQAGNTSLVAGATISQKREILLSLEKMNNILEFDPDGGIVHLEPGVILENLQEFLKEESFSDGNSTIWGTPYDLGARGSCMVGGNVATLAGGINFVKYGSLRNYILGLEVVLSDGTVLDMMKAITKDNTGPKLKEVFIGSEGTLGVITKVCMQCVALDKETELVFIETDSYENVLEMHDKAKQLFGKNLSAIEYLDQECYNLVHKVKSEVYNFPIQPKTENSNSPKKPFYLLIEISTSESDSDSPEELSEAMSQFYDSSEAMIQDMVLASSQNQRDSIWGIRESVVEAATKSGYVFKYDVSLPIQHFEDLVKETRNLFGEEVDLVGGYGHIGDGNIHLNLMRFGPKEQVEAGDGRMGTKEVKKAFESKVEI